MKISKIIDDVKDGIDEVKLKVEDVVDKAELDKHAKEIGDVAVDKAKEFGDVAVVAAQNLAEVINKGKNSWNLKRLKPIFLNDLNGMQCSRLVRIVEREKKFDIDVCEGSIGYWDTCKGEKWMNIFKDSVSKFGLSFYPNDEVNFYYVDPTNKDNYIVLDEYFYRLKQARVSELQKIAQDLGAKYFKVTYMKEKTTLSKKSANGKGSIHKKGNGSAQMNATEQKYDRMDIAAEMSFPGHEPVMPHVRYLKYDPNILNLIEMRMDTKGPINHQILNIKLSSSSGLKETDAVKVDMILKSLKMAGNTTVSSEAKNEAKSILKYEIDF
ncbi:hypothetical protein [Catenibacterium mitsuokai]|uniref:hypothetical protein n=1 Tax=Catenibacterium mitsuokai TaxID=100886 RepID=UPI00242EB4CB|nr:hypothetical protein [Catenibacterium mitsuokai]MCI6076814.1 hypothetical protein [Catenibacterium mitsuokai]